MYYNYKIPAPSQQYGAAQAGVLLASPALTSSSSYGKTFILRLCNRNILFPSRFSSVTIEEILLLAELHTGVFISELILSRDLSIFLKFRCFRLSNESNKQLKYLKYYSSSIAAVWGSSNWTIPGFSN
jgi:hypothetical protein